MVGGRGGWAGGPNGFDVGLHGDDGVMVFVLALGVGPIFTTRRG